MYTQNAFSRFAQSLGHKTTKPDVFKALVVDLMHEFELGVWKAVLIHLIRMLHTCGQRSIDEFNKR